MAEQFASTRSRQYGSATQRFQQVWRDWRWFAVALIGLLVFRSVMADWNQVPTGSMRPTIAIGDQIVVDKSAYDIRLPFTHVSLVSLRDPQRGDIVTFPSPLDGQLYVKRVVALPGDRVVMRGNILTVNDVSARYEPRPSADPAYRVFEETLLGSSRLVQRRVTPRPGARDSFGPIVIPAGSYLVLGDNRDESFDSRAIGVIPRETMLGQATAVAFSLDYDDGFKPRNDRVLDALR